MAADRNPALDALRGLAMAGMVLSGLLPSGVLPWWMYHAQNPPPSHVFAPTVLGITWVDLIFPLFLFAMGVALPLALDAQARKGLSCRQLAAGVVQRAAMMAAFAIYVRHIAPHIVHFPEPWQGALFALAGFSLLFPLLARLPRHWSRAAQLGVRAAGLAGAAVLMALFRDAHGAPFSIARSDIIMLVLANAALAAGLLWLATRTRPELRLLFLALLLALRLGHGEPGWAHWLWQASPWPELMQTAFLQYLFIVIPGTLAGDMLLKLRQDEAPWRMLAQWGCWALLLAFALNPYEGGIQKGRATLSYYAGGVAAGALLLAALSLLVERLDWKARIAAGAGRNPLLVYAGVQALLKPLLLLTGLGALIQEWTMAPWVGVGRALVYTLALCWFAAWCARRGLELKL
ncbi:DUF5009 domain-containing protein [Pseudoduganella aquatica]|uniref:DUF5009 domain-containing protein n=1 Tax=Pseudoduganella aquatica TaxID=2660641 RepID=A0A7X4HAM2_9BURK|nr:DUF5009 domain-containing protein [Pseudoduganella aquatica]MYN06755.1 DUF5009 domain-containing protein [Pseudoduganella aquatica]